ncbi:MAG: DUF1795 domain-containing protein [Ruminococcaceae bacterium]|nr:DUF1795 domain-containing protein [Oscillospiraceae bacterium]
MKSTTRLFMAALCAVILLLSFASCGVREGEEVPNGMQIACCVNADYRLYVPNSWVPNTSYGISGAYRDLGNQSTVTVQSYAKADYAEQLTAAGADLTESASRIAAFWSILCLEPIAARAMDNLVKTYEEECVSTSLDGVNAKQYRYSALINGTTLHFLQVVADGEENYYVFTFTATAEMFELYRPEVNMMLSSFVFDDPYVPVDYAKYLDDGANAPEGMRAAFGDDVAYCFYVPSSWEVCMDEQIYSAYVPSDMSGVSVVPYMPQTEQMSVAQYFAMSEDMMKKMMREESDYNLLQSGEKAQLGGREATVYEFTLRIGGVNYRYRQYIAAYKSMIYALTYTATEANFEAHLNELDQIVGAFVFR